MGCGCRWSSQEYNSANSRGVRASIARSISWTVFKPVASVIYFSWQATTPGKEWDDPYRFFRW